MVHTGFIFGSLIAILVLGIIFSLIMVFQTGETTNGGDSGTGGDSGSGTGGDSGGGTGDDSGGGTGNDSGNDIAMKVGDSSNCPKQPMVSDTNSGGLQTTGTSTPFYFVNSGGSCVSTEGLTGIPWTVSNYSTSSVILLAKYGNENACNSPFGTTLLSLPAGGFYSSINDKNTLKILLYENMLIQPKRDTTALLDITVPSGISSIDFVFTDDAQYPICIFTKS